jgi:hypothetical protein
METPSFGAPCPVQAFPAPPKRLGFCRARQTRINGKKFQAMQSEKAMSAAETIFDVGIDERLSYDQLFILGLQNIFGMTGMFVFPGILG